MIFLITSLFIYARFIERNIILTKTTKIETGFSSKLIVAADFHLGVYKDINFLKRIVKKINKIKNADAVLIPGDFTYYAPEDLETLFSPLKDIKFPTYAILGNHDSEQPGPPIQAELQKALENNGVIFLHNSSEIIKNKNIKILGLGDKSAGEDDLSKINEFKKSDNLIVITHNPDTALEYKNSIPDITISGHTHGGQIRIPFLYKYAIPCSGDFDQGLYETNYGKIFVTAGLGEVGLPMRLGIPPTIEVLKLY
ncbi:MAG: metallophosphoesterase [Patescibacteria group bacterium]|nr:metallophosphoesterase [Patescibacteria group bacterium]